MNFLRIIFFAKMRTKLFRTHCFKRKWYDEWL